MILHWLRTNKKEAFFLGPCFVLFLASAVALYFSLRSPDLFSTGNQVGQVIKQGEDVKLRSALKTFWRIVEPSHPLRSGDRVFAGRLSRAETHFRTTTAKIFVQSNSLMRIRSEDEALPPEIDLEFGSALYRGDVQSKILFRGAVLSGAGEFLLEAQPEVQVYVSKGDIQLKMGDSTRVLKAGHRYGGPEFKLLEKYDITLVTPDLGTDVLIKKNQAVLLSWKAPFPLQHQTVTIGFDPDLKKEAQEIMAFGSSLPVDLKHGKTYFWRVSGLKTDNSPVKSAIGTFRTLGGSGQILLTQLNQASRSPASENACQDFSNMVLTPAELLAQPVMGKIPATYELDYEMKSNGTYQTEHPLFRWVKNDLATSYRLVIASDKEMRNRYREEYTDKEQFSWKQSRPGYFYVAVSALNRDYTAMDPKVSFPFQVRLAPPKNIRVITATFTTEKNKTEVNLSWLAHPMSERFEIQSSEKPDFRNSESFYSDFAKAAWSSRDSGKIYVRVRALDAQGNPLSRFSQVFALTLNQGKAQIDEKETFSLREVAPSWSDTSISQSHQKEWAEALGFGVSSLNSVHVPVKEEFVVFQANLFEKTACQLSGQ